jgi:hypothetical protein
VGNQDFKLSGHCYTGRHSRLSPCPVQRPSRLEIFKRQEIKISSYLCRGLHTVTIRFLIERAHNQLRADVWPDEIDDAAVALSDLLNGDLS